MRSIDADELKKVFNGYHSGIGSQPKFTLGACLQLIDNAPTVQPNYFPPCEDCNKKMEEIRQAYDKMKAMERPQSDKWIPIKTRELTEEEKEEYPDCTFMYDCKLPEDGEEVLVTTWYGDVALDNFCRDDGCYFEAYCDEGDAIAWMPKPEPYKKEGEEE